MRRKSRKCTPETAALHALLGQHAFRLLGNAGRLLGNAGIAVPQAEVERATALAI